MKSRELNIKADELYCDILFYAIQCKCGKVFRTDAKWAEWYVDSIILKKDVKYDMSAETALSKYRVHKEELIQRILEEHKVVGEC